MYLLWTSLLTYSGIVSLAGIAGSQLNPVYTITYVITVYAVTYVIICVHHYLLTVELLSDTACGHKRYFPSTKLSL